MPITPITIAAQHLSNVQRKLYLGRAVLPSVFELERALIRTCAKKGPDFLKALSLAAHVAAFEPELARQLSAENFMEGLALAAEKISAQMPASTDRARILSVLQTAFRVPLLRQMYSNCAKQAGMPPLKLASIIKAFCPIKIRETLVADMTEEDFLWLHAERGMDIERTCQAINEVRKQGLRQAVDLAELKTASPDELIKLKDQAVRLLKQEDVIEKALAGIKDPKAACELLAELSDKQITRLLNQVASNFQTAGKALDLILKSLDIRFDKNRLKTVFLALSRQECWQLLCRASELRLQQFAAAFPRWFKGSLPKFTEINWQKDV